MDKNHFSPIYLCCEYQSSQCEFSEKKKIIINKVFLSEMKNTKITVRRRRFILLKLTPHSTKQIPPKKLICLVNTQSIINGLPLLLIKETLAGSFHEIKKVTIF